MPPFPSSGDPYRLSWRAWILVLAAGQLFISLHGLARVSVLALDDTFIYFNYAKHLAAGDGFVFDPRGIPSEGVTSLLYLLMLVPWEMARANPMTGAVLYNALACILTGNLLGWAAYRNGLLNRWMAPLVPLLFILACCYDKSIRLVTFRGLETMLGPMGVVVCCLCASNALRRPEHPAAGTAAARCSDRFERHAMAYMVAAFCTYLIRPEYLAYLGLVGLVLLFRPSRLPALWKAGILLMVLFAALFVWKWQVFGSLMPTAYYRKMAGTERNGAAYVFQWIAAYWPLLAAASAGLLLERSLWKKPLIQGLLLASVANVLLVLRMQILVGYGYRFLILPIVVGYAIVLIAGLSSLQQRPRPTKRMLLYPLGGAILLAVSFLIKPLPLGYPQAWNLASRAEQAFEENAYFHFADHLKKSLPDPEAFTLSFGDAGTLPYALGCRYLDPNGLSEPAIAALFREPDSPEKAERFADLLFGPEPDMVILPLGTLQGSNDCHAVVSMNPHDPFQGAIPAAYWERLRDEQFVYACELDLHYPLQVVLRSTSPLYSVLREALRTYCEENEGRLAHAPLCVRGHEFQLSFPSAFP